MEAAVATLLAEAGVNDVASPALQAGVRRYVMSLLASTSGYHQEAPLASPRLQVGCGCTCEGDGQPQQHRRRQQQQQQQQQEQQEQRACSAAVPPPSAAVASATYTWREHHVRFVSQCEHHMLPFYGSVHIAYIPACHGCEAHKGMSHDQAEQVVAAYTQRLQVQERITQQVADAVSALTGASGVVVAVRAAHMCMVARGVENHAGSTITRTASGEFELRPELRARFLRAVAVRSEASACGSAPEATCGCGC
jgi:GTP cyclohydrolase I